MRNCMSKLVKNLHLSDLLSGQIAEIQAIENIFKIKKYKKINR